MFRNIAQFVAIIKDDVILLVTLLYKKRKYLFLSVLPLPAYLFLSILIFTLYLYSYFNFCHFI